MTTKTDLPHWETIQAHETVDYGILGVQQVERRSPRTGRVGRYQVIHTTPWVNVVALTPTEEVVLIRQYRHGIDDLTLEIPGGVVDPGEDAAVAAARELLEETGFAGSDPVFLGKNHPNPGIQSNECSSFLVTDARQVAEQRPDDGEHIEVVQLPLVEVPDLIVGGAITHALVVCAFHYLSIHRQ